MSSSDHTFYVQASASAVDLVEQVLDGALDDAEMVVEIEPDVSDVNLLAADVYVASDAQLGMHDALQAARAALAEAGYKTITSEQRWPTAAY